MVNGVIAVDAEDGKEYELKAKVVINATGVFTDSIRQMDDKNALPVITPSQGVHIVLDRSFLPGDSAIMVPETDDGRVLFAIPWHNCVIIGTTDTPVKTITSEPQPLKEEIDFLLSHAARYLINDPKPCDVLSMFAGLRPLASVGDTSNTAAISRDHVLHISRSGLVTIAGGKWTTYRKMADDTIDQAAILAQLEIVPSITHELPIHGFHKKAEIFGELAVYGSDAPALLDLIAEKPEYDVLLYQKLPTRVGEVIWAVRHEMARKVEDFLSRRSRCLLLNAQASIEIAPKVARIMAQELNQDNEWVEQQINMYKELAEKYIVN